MNRPYVKQINSKGELMNPIVGSYTSIEDNRKSRRESLNKDRNFSNKKGKQILVTKIGFLNFIKFERTTQTIGNKTITHYTQKAR